MTSHEQGEQIEELLASPTLADALESENFRHFLDQIPVAIVVSEMKSAELIVYVNPQFERLFGQTAASLEGHPWTAIRGEKKHDAEVILLGSALVEGKDRLGTFRIEAEGEKVALVDAYSNVIVNEADTPCYRLAAFIDVSAIEQTRLDEFDKLIREKDVLLQEIQHRVRNNLQMITALIRLEARNERGDSPTASLDRLAGRIQALHVLYGALGPEGHSDEVDLGVYLSQIATAVIQAHATEGIRLDLKVDSYPVSVNVAMPAGLVVNELLTNALKHAFKGKSGGTITLHSLTEGNNCRVIIADDGIGLPEGTEWPQRGKLGMLIVRSLRTNANASFEIESRPGEGVKAVILFTRAASAPDKP